MRILDQLLIQLEREGTVCGSVVSVVGGVRGALVCGGRSQGSIHVWWAESGEHSCVVGGVREHPCVVGGVRGAPMCGGRSQGSIHV